MLLLLLLLLLLLFFCFFFVCTWRGNRQGDDGRFLAIRGTANESGLHVQKWNAGRDKLLEIRNKTGSWATYGETGEKLTYGETGEKLTYAETGEKLTYAETGEKLCVHIYNVHTEIHLRSDSQRKASVTIQCSAHEIPSHLSLSLSLTARRK